MKGALLDLPARGHFFKCDCPARQWHSHDGSSVNLRVRVLVAHLLMTK